MLTNANDSFQLVNISLNIWFVDRSGHMTNRKILSHWFAIFVRIAEFDKHVACFAAIDKTWTTSNCTQAYMSDVESLGGNTSKLCEWVFQETR